jgi:pimeloyl-ACP methyl ester carboxylesterase
MSARMGKAPRICVLIAMIAGLGTPAFAQRAETSAIERADGSRLIFHVDRRGLAGRRPMLLVLQGSGCAPVGADARVNSYGPMLAPDHVQLMIEKYGAAAGGDSLVEGCTAAFWSGNTLSRRVADAVQVIARLRGERWWNGALVIFGGSEGGAVAAMLAPLIPEARAVIIWSSGIGVPVGALIRGAIPPEAASQAEPAFAEARRNPTGERIWGGASYAWWADALDMVPARSLLDVRVPILLIHGSRDQFAPVATARATRDLLAQAGRSTFTYREYDGYDHFMVDAAGADHRPEVLAAAGRWLQGLARR